MRTVLLISLILGLTSSLRGRKDLITSISAKKNVLKISVHEGFKKKYLTSDFFVRYEKDIDLASFDYSILSMPFVMNVISIIWISGDTYHVDEMDEELFESLKRVKKVFQTMYPNTQWNGKLKVDTLVKHTPPFEKNDTKTALLFSGGLDSVSTALNHRDKKQLLITAWGHWDLPLHHDTLWKVRSRKIAQFAHRFGNEATSFRSNYTTMLNYKYLSSLSDEIPKWRLGAVEGLGWAGLTAPILLSRGYSTLRIASSHTWNYPYPSAASPFVDNNLYFCGLRVEHDQFDMTRLMKVKYICDTYKQLKKKRPFIKVCSYEKESDRNCHECRKCLSTILCFKALGEDPEPYGLSYNEDVGDAIMKEFKKKKLNYYTILLGREVQDLIKGKPFNSMLMRFLRINFDTATAFDVEKQTQLNWSNMLLLLFSKNRINLST